MMNITVNGRRATSAATSRCKVMDFLSSM